MLKVMRCAAFEHQIFIKELKLDIVAAHWLRQGNRKLLFTPYLPMYICISFQDLLNIKWNGGPTKIIRGADMYVGMYKSSFLVCSNNPYI
jgi:hypothetical protein